MTFLSPKCFLIMFLCLTGNPLYSQIPYAHAHNDYQHQRSLLDALDQEFTSVEADVHLINGELYVYHDHPGNPDPERTLEQLYLIPLSKRIEANGGAVYPGFEQPFLLLVDIKTAAEPTYSLLKQKLEPYRDLLHRYQGDKVLQKGALMIVLSGNRPIKTVSEEKERWVAIDGRPSDLGKGYAPTFMPLISDHYRKQLSWNGKGKIPDSQLIKLQTLAKKVHAEGKVLRLWATPEKEKLWQFLLDGGVDYLNTDLLVQLNQFSKTYLNHGK